MSLLPQPSKTGFLNMNDEPTHREATPPPRYDLLALCSGASFLLLALGGWLTSLGLGPWYDALRLPPFQPPAWVFTPMWTIVLSLLAVATWLVGREPHAPGRGRALALYGAQCVLNAGWSLLFFSLQRPDAALWELLVLNAVLVAMIAAYWRVSRLAGLLITPYLAWLLLATAINVWVVQNNGPAAPTPGAALRNNGGSPSSLIATEADHRVQTTRSKPFLAADLRVGGLPRQQP
ncbi:MAG: TspO/MBR family protein [Planctomycetota bacterium]